MGHALGIPVHGVCSLDALAEQALAEPTASSEVLVATDARRKEVYWARYGRGADGAVALTEPAVDRPAELPEAVRGPADRRARAAALPRPVRARRSGGPLDVDRRLRWAGWRCAGWRRATPMPVEPLYLRRPDAADHRRAGSCRERR